MGALREMATTKRHVNVLQHMAGYFSKQLILLPSELQSVIQDFHWGLFPLLFPSH